MGRFTWGEWDLTDTEAGLSAAIYTAEMAMDAATLGDIPMADYGFWLGVSEECQRLYGKRKGA